MSGGYRKQSIPRMETGKYQFVLVKGVEIMQTIKTGTQAGQQKPVLVLTLQCQEDGEYNGVVLNHRIWVNERGEGVKTLSAESMQIIEALIGEEIGDDEETPPIEALAGRVCILHIGDEGQDKWPKIIRAEKIDAKPRKATSKAAPKAKAAPKTDTTDPGDADDDGASTDASPKSGGKGKSMFKFGDDEE